VKPVVLITAGGKGLRAGSPIPKQFVEINGIPLLVYTVKKFTNFLNNIPVVITLPQGYEQTWKTISNSFLTNVNMFTCDGGATRFESVRNGLHLIEESLPESDLIAVHDAARPFVNMEVIKDSFETAERLGSAIPLTAISNSIRKINSNGETHAVNRSEYREVQTPQVFRAKELIKSYNQKYKESFTDDASVFEADGNKTYWVKGDPMNVKITNAHDLKLAELLLNNE